MVVFKPRQHSLAIALNIIWTFVLDFTDSNSTHNGLRLRVMRHECLKRRSKCESSDSSCCDGLNCHKRSKRGDKSNDCNGHTYKVYAKLHSFN